MTYISVLIVIKNYHLGMSWKSMVVRNKSPTHVHRYLVLLVNVADWRIRASGGCLADGAILTHSLCN